MAPLSTALVPVCFRHCVAGCIGKGTHLIIFSQARCGQGFASQAEQFHGNREAHQLGELSVHVVWSVIGYQCTCFDWMAGSPKGKGIKDDNGLMNENAALFYTHGLSSTQTWI